MSTRNNNLIEHLQDSGKLPTLPSWRGINKGQVLVSATGLLVMGAADMAMHFDKTGVFLGLLVAGGVVRHSNDILHVLVPGSDAKQVVENTARVVDQVVPVTYTYVDQSAQAKLKRLFGFRSGNNSGLYLQSAPAARSSAPEPEKPAPGAPVTETRKGLIKWGTSVQFGRRFDPFFNQVFGRGILLTGTQGAGKSNIIGETVASAAKNDVPCLLIDYKNEFYTLREIHKTIVSCGHPGYAERAGAPYYPLTSDNAAEFAADLMSNGWQAVFNVQSYRDPDEMAVVLSTVLHALVDWSLDLEDDEDRIPCLVITDEAHNLVPEQPALSALPLDPKNFKLLKKAYVEVANTGRSFGYTLIMATQRLANIANWSVANLQIQVLMRQDLDSDIDRCEDYIGKGKREELRNLPAGRGFVRGLSKTPMLVQFDRQEARHVSKTPDLARAQKKFRNAERLPVSRVLQKRVPGTVHEYEPVRDSSSGVPVAQKRPNLSVVPPQTGTPEQVPAMDTNTPAERAGLVPEVFQQGPDDLLLSGLQIKLLIIHYEETHNIKESLQQIRNEKGQGLGSRYAKHASFILEQRGLKKRGA